LFGIRLIKCRFAFIKIYTLKIEQVLAHYLLKNKQLTLQGIGTFHLEASLPDSADPDKPIYIPADAVSFDYNPKVTEDDQLVDFLVEHTKKIKPLASSDLDSFLSLGRQFLNIGKPFVLQNIGTLEKANSGELIFTGGQPVAPRMEPQKAKIEDEGAEQHEENLFNDYQKERIRGNGKQTLFVILTVVILGLIIWAAWHFIVDNSGEKIETTDSVVPVADSTDYKDSVAAVQALNSNGLDGLNNSDTSGFKVIVNQFQSLQAATNRLNTLKRNNRNVEIYTEDSVSYKIGESFNLPLSDTTRIMDSLSRYYGRKKLQLEF